MRGRFSISRSAAASASAARRASSRAALDATGGMARRVSADGGLGAAAGSAFAGALAGSDLAAGCWACAAGAAACEEEDSDLVASTTGSGLASSALGSAGSVLTSGLASWATGSAGAGAGVDSDSGCAWTSGACSLTGRALRPRRIQRRSRLRRLGRFDYDGLGLGRRLGGSLRLHGRGFADRLLGSGGRGRCRHARFFCGSGGGFFFRSHGGGVLLRQFGRIALDEDAFLAHFDLDGARATGGVRLTDLGGLAPRQGDLLAFGRAVGRRSESSNFALSLSVTESSTDLRSTPAERNCSSSTLAGIFSSVANWATVLLDIRLSLPYMQL